MVGCPIQAFRRLEWDDQSTPSNNRHSRKKCHPEAKPKDLRCLKPRRRRIQSEGTPLLDFCSGPPSSGSLGLKKDGTSKKWPLRLSPAKESPRRKESGRDYLLTFVELYMATIFIIDDDAASELLATNLTYRGHTARRIRSVHDALHNIDQIATSDLVVLDLVMPYGAGPEIEAEGYRSAGMHV